MARTLLAQDIIGHRLKRILSAAREPQRGLDHVPIWFELESGIIFELPSFGNEQFEESQLPPDAEPIEHPSVRAVLGARIERVVRPADHWQVTPGTVCMCVEGGRWLRVVAFYPSGVAYAGLHVSEDNPISEKTVDFWTSGRSAT